MIGTDTIKEMTIEVEDDIRVVVGVETEGEKEKVLDRIDLGLGISSSLGIHVGREHGARGFIQQSTGTIAQINLRPAFSIKSGFLNWREVR